ncbi:MAG: hypothetical protein J1G02_03005 [Clostridiales bacterium]|nr:hypothetical protein [Clostridiales bacterium]
MLEVFFKGALIAVILVMAYPMFAKLKTKKWLIIRIVVSSIFDIFSLIALMVLVFNKQMIESGDNWFGFFYLIPICAFSVRMTLDGQKYNQADQWEKAHPNYEQERLRKQQEREYKKRLSQYKKLTERCGIKFFIKYYSQIKRLPLRDIVIEENYSVHEKEERLKAAKLIIKKRLTEFVVSQILIEYADVLGEDEVLTANKILHELC